MIFKERVTIQEKTINEGAAGTEVTWADSETRWAKVSHISLQGQAQHQAIGRGGVEFRITFRGKVSLTLDNRFSWNDTYLYPVVASEEIKGDLLNKYTLIDVRRSIQDEE